MTKGMPWRSGTMPWRYTFVPTRPYDWEDVFDSNNHFFWKPDREREFYSILPTHFIPFTILMICFCNENDFLWTMEVNSIKPISRASWLEPECYCNEGEDIQDLNETIIGNYQAPFVEHEIVLLHIFSSALKVVPCCSLDLLQFCSTPFLPPVTTHGGENIYVTAGLLGRLVNFDCSVSYYSIWLWINRFLTSLVQIVWEKIVPPFIN